MSNDDVTVTDRDRAAASNILEMWGIVGHSIGTDITQALAQARSEGREESKRAGHQLCQLTARADAAEEALRVARPDTERLDWLENRATSPEGKDVNWHVDDGYTYGAFDDARIVRIESSDTLNRKYGEPSLRDAIDAIMGTPTTASTKTDANECKEDLVEFLKAVWDPDTGFTNSNGFYRQLGPLYEKYCGTKTAQEDAK